MPDFAVSYFYANDTRRPDTLPPDLLGELINLARSITSALLFTTAGAILAVNRPQWPGSWLLLAGAIMSSVLAGLRLLGILPPATDLWLALGYEAFETASFLLAGLGILLVSMRARRETI